MWCWRCEGFPSINLKGVDMSYRNVALGIASIALAAGTALPALATTTAASGGTWSYGTNGNGTTVYSNYYHPSLTHRGSTINYWGEYSCTTGRAGAWANNSQRADPTRGHTDNSYYATRAC